MRVMCLEAPCLAASGPGKCGLQSAHCVWPDFGLARHSSRSIPRNAAAAAGFRSQAKCSIINPASQRVTGRWLAWCIRLFPTHFNRTLLSPRIPSAHDRGRERLGHGEPGPPWLIRAKYENQHRSDFSTYEVVAALAAPAHPHCGVYYTESPDVSKAKMLLKKISNL